MTHGSEKKLKNLGPVSLRWLEEIGVNSLADLERMGPVEAFCRVKAMGHRPSLNFLYALEGAVRDMDWRELEEGAKAELRSSVSATR